MQRYNGTTRTVFIVGPIAFKVAKIRFLKAFLYLLSICKKRQWKILLKHLFIYKPEQYMTAPFLFFGGIQANLLEFFFFWRSQHSFLQPTLFSFFGIFNIQISGRQNKEKSWDTFAKIIVKSDLKGVKHTFFESNNFCWYRNQLRIVDYGSRKVQRVINIYGNKMIVAFNKH